MDHSRINPALLRAPVEMPAEAEGVVGVKGVLEVLRRRWKIVFGVIMLALLAAVLLLTQLTPRYIAKSQLMLNFRSEQVVDIEAVISGLPADSAVVRSEMDVLSSRRLAGKVIDRLGLMDNPEFNSSLKPKLDLVALLGIGPLLEEGYLRDVLDALRGPQVVQNSPDTEDTRLRSEVIDAFKEKLRITNDGRSFTIKISFESENATLARDVTNALSDVYLNEQLEAKYRATERANSWLSERLNELRNKVRDAESAVQRYQEQNELIKSSGTLITDQQISELNTQLILSRAETAQAEARLTELEDLLASAGSAESFGEVLSSPLIQKLREQEAGVLRAEAELATKYGDKHPRMIKVRAELEDIQRTIRQEVAKVVSGLRSELVVAKARERTLSNNLKQLQQQQAKVNRSSVTLRELERDASATKALYNTFLTRFKETSSQSDYQETDARIISPALLPYEPSFPRKKLILVLALIAGTVLGVALAYLIELFDAGFRTSQQLERETGIHCFGMIPKVRLRRRDRKSLHKYISSNPTSAYCEALRSVYTGLYFSSPEQKPQVLTITSTIPGEGKTSFTSSLGHILAKSGKRVIVVEGDLRRPKVRTVYDVAPESDFAALLRGEASLEEAVVEDPESGVALLSVSKSIDDPQALLQGAAFDQTIGTLRQQYDVILIDSPPVLAVSDAIFLAKQSDALLYVTAWEKTRRDLIRQGLNLLDGASVRVTGLVLSMVDLKKHSKYAYGDQGYYYGRYSQYYSK